MEADAGRQGKEWMAAGRLLSESRRGEGARVGWAGESRPFRGPPGTELGQHRALARRLATLVPVLAVIAGNGPGREGPGLPLKVGRKPRTLQAQKVEANASGRAVSLAACVPACQEQEWSRNPQPIDLLLWVLPGR
jgi:hypothetical protein